MIDNSHANKDRNSYNNLKAVHFEIETAMNFDKDFGKCVWHRKLMVLDDRGETYLYIKSIQSKICLKFCMLI